MENTILFYTGGVILSMFFAWISQKPTTHIFKQAAFWLSCFILLFIIGLRDSTGIDDPAYQYIFEEVQRSGWFTQFLQTTMEPGYLFLNYCVSIFSKDYIVLQFITASIPMILFWKGFKKYQYILSIPLSILLFASTLYFQMLAVALIRMFIAISIVFYSLDYLFLDRKRQYIIAIFIASLFHYSSLIMLLFLAFNSKQLILKWRRYLLYLIFACPIVVVLVAKIASGILGERYSEYSKIGNFTFDLFAFDTLPFFFFALYFVKFINNKFLPMYLLLLLLLAFSSIISLLGSLVSLGRIIFYCNLSLLIILPFIYRLLRHPLLKLIHFLVFVFYSILYLYVSQFTNLHHIGSLTPYRNIFFVIS